MNAKYTRDGVYKNEDGRFYIRPKVNGKRTWRVLQATTLKYALEEARALATDQARAKVGTGHDPYEDASFKKLASAYLEAGCPNKRLEPRHAKFQGAEKHRLEYLTLFFGNTRADAIRISMIPGFAVWRRKRVKKAGCAGDRTIDQDLVTVSNVLNYGVVSGRLEFNPIASGRPRHQKNEDIRSSTERSIANGDELHRLADFFFDHPKSEVMGWVAIFSALIGCRQVELRGLRIDAASKNDPGYIEGNHLFIRRAKRGINPFIEIKGEFADALECFQLWHAEQFPPGSECSTQWFFPGRSRGKLDPSSFCHALHRACRVLKISRCSPHGFRSFYVTKRRGDGASDTQIAYEIGDKTVAIIAQSYGDLPPNWVGQNKLSFLPSQGLPSWARWRPATEKIVAL